MSVFNMKFVLFLLHILIFSPFAFGDTITLCGIVRAPYVTGDEAKPGFLVEIAQSAFEPNGHTVEFEALPWKRAIIMVRQNTKNGLVGVIRRNVPDFIFPDEEQAFQQQRFFVNSGNPWKYKGLLSLKQVYIGVIGGYSYGQMDSYIQKYKYTKFVQEIFGYQSLERNIRKLERNRISVVLEDHIIMNYALKILGKTEQFTEAGSLFGENVYISFSPNNPKSIEYATLLSNAMHKIRENGKLEEILNKYGIQDWKE